MLNALTEKQQLQTCFILDILSSPINDILGKLLYYVPLLIFLT